jgi:hypothetical protein
MKGRNMKNMKGMHHHNRPSKADHGPKPWDRLFELDLPTQNDQVMCISVMDENNNVTTDKQWRAFQKAFPNRDFCLLQPVPSTFGDLYVPRKFRMINKLIYHQVNRPYNDPSQADDWYNFCNLDKSKAKGLRKVILFVDHSGSMDPSVVKASLNLFVKTAIRNGFEIIETKYSTAEDYITPCATTNVY